MTNAHSAVLHQLENNMNLAGSAEAIAQGKSVAEEATETMRDQFNSKLSYGETRAAYTWDFEGRYISWLLERQNGNISAAAREARMDRKHLHDLAKKHGLRDPKGRGAR